MLTTDAALNGNESIMTQMQERGNRDIAFASETQTKSQRRKSATKRELLSKVNFTNHFQTYLLIRKFVIVTDHQELV